MRMRGAWATHLLGRVHAGDVDELRARPHALGPRCRGYHLTNLGLHVATALAVYAVTRELVGVAWDGQLAAHGGALAAAVAALAFALHPLRAEPVAWLSARGTCSAPSPASWPSRTYLAGWSRGRDRGASPAALARRGGAPLRCRRARARDGLVLPALLLRARRLSPQTHPGPHRRLVGPGCARVLTEKLGLAALGALAIPMGLLARSRDPGTSGAASTIRSWPSPGASTAAPSTCGRPCGPWISGPST